METLQEDTENMETEKRQREAAIEQKTKETELDDIQKQKAKLMTNLKKFKKDMYEFEKNLAQPSCEKLVKRE